MNSSSESRYLRTLIAILRIVLGVIILVTWWENLQKGLYTAQGITDLLTHPDWGAFSNGGGALPGYQPIINATVLQVPGAFGAFQMVAELLIGLGLLFGALTPLAGAGASFFFLNLLLTYSATRRNGSGPMFCSSPWPSSSPSPVLDVNWASTRFCFANGANHHWEFFGNYLNSKIRSGKHPEWAIARIEGCFPGSSHPSIHFSLRSKHSGC